MGSNNRHRNNRRDNWDQGSIRDSKYRRESQSQSESERQWQQWQIFLQYFNISFTKKKPNNC